jgi:TetR/AcrR family transcriptional regulator
MTASAEKTGLLNGHSPRQVLKEGDNRQAILDAATQEFGEKGFAGARVHAIAAGAGVNIALLYYYFNTKEELYAAVLEQLFADWAQRVTAALGAHYTPKQKLIAYAEAYFDFVAEAPHRPRLVQQEMSQLGAVAVQSLAALAKQYVRPMHQAVLKVLNDGYEQGEFRRVSPDFVHTISALIVTYFTSSAFIQVVTGHNPLTPARIAERRNSVLDTVSAALFASSESVPIKRKEGHQ